MTENIVVKPVFTSYIPAEKSGITKEFFDQLQAKFPKVSYCIEDMMAIISAPKEQYERVLQEGIKIALALPLRSTYWLNYYGKKRPLGYIPIGLGFFAEDEFLVETDELPDDVKKYINDLKVFLPVRVYIIKSKDTNAMEFLAVGDHKTHADIVDEFCIFNQEFKSKGKIPFIKLSILSSTGEQIQPIYERGVEDSSGCFLEKK